MRIRDPRQRRPRPERSLGRVNGTAWLTLPLPRMRIPGRLRLFAPCLAAALLCSCARRQELPPAHPGAAEAERADAVVESVLSVFLPPAWPQRRVVPEEGGRPAALIQPLPLSSLAYLPRLLPRLRESLAAAGFPADEGASASSSLAVFLPSGEVLRYDFSQSVAGRLALVIDDVGRSMASAARLEGLDYPLTLAILPRLPHTREWDALAHEHDYEVILHCPLSALDPELDLGPGGIADDLPPEEIAAILRKDLASVPHAVGVNNHMGSAFTLLTEPMRAFLEELNDQELFFLDSLTSPRTVTRALAEETDIPTAARDVFLDHENTEEFILKQIGSAARRALKNGRAIAIGHYRPLTLQILEREIPALAGEGVQIVPLSDLMPGRGETRE